MSSYLTHINTSRSGVKKTPSSCKSYVDFGYPEIEEDGLPLIISGKDLEQMDFDSEPYEPDLLSDFCPECGKKFYADPPDDGSEPDDCQCPGDLLPFYQIIHRMLDHALRRYE